MNDDEGLTMLLRAALGPGLDREPAKDLWPLIAERARARAGWSWLDLGIAAAITLFLLMRPGWVWLLASHL